MAPPTARQIEYAMALGIDIPSRIDLEGISPLIDAAVKKLDSPPNAKQLKMANEFGIEIPNTVKTSRDVVDLLYEHLKARRWVYSVIRHVVGADWSRYSQSGLADQYANKIASALKNDKKLMAKIEKREGGNHISGGDVWYRITEKGASSPEYLFVKSFELPDEVVASINTSRSNRAKGGCFTVILLMFVVGGVILITTI